MEGVEKELRDKVLTNIVLQYREQQKHVHKYEKVNLFPLWRKYDMKYSDFLDVILALEGQGYLHYEKAGKDKEKIHINGEYVPQEFVTLEDNAKSFPEDLSDEKTAEINNNLKRPFQVQLLTILMTILLSSASLGLLWQIIKWFLSLFHS